MRYLVLQLKKPAVHQYHSHVPSMYDLTTIEGIPSGFLLSVFPHSSEDCREVSPQRKPKVLPGSLEVFLVVMSIKAARRGRTGSDFFNTRSQQVCRTSSRESTRVSHLNCFHSLPWVASVFWARPSVISWLQCSNLCWEYSRRLVFS